jgi:purine-nucleoside phosphorylase
MPTPHIAAAPGAFADVCLLPGDPLRARWVAESFLDDVVAVTAIRNMEGYTGTYRGRRVSVMGTGMGIPSASIYATELIRHYAVTSLIRIGTCGGLATDVGLRDLIVVTGASTDSNVNRQRFGGMDLAAVADFGLTRSLVEAAESRGIPIRVGAVFSADLFYHPRADVFDLARRVGLLAVEMEAAGLFGVAAEHGVRAGAILTVADRLEDEAALDADARQASLADMTTVALEAARRG